MDQHTDVENHLTEVSVESNELFVDLETELAEPEETEQVVGSAEVEIEREIITEDETSVDATQIYLAQIGRTPLLSPEEEVEYGRLAKNGCMKAKNRMIESNLRLVVKIARRYLNRGLALGDLIEEGNLGLIRAVEKFDPERGFRFSTYGTWWIRQTIERAIMNQTRSIRLPIHVVKELNIYLRTGRDLQHVFHHEVGAKEISQKLNKTSKEVEEILVLNEKTTSLDSIISTETERTLVDNIPDDPREDPGEIIAYLNINKEIDSWLSGLTEKQCEVICRRFGLRGYDHGTLEQVGEQVGLTRERVRQIQVEALSHLKYVARHKGLAKDLLNIYK